MNEKGAQTADVLTLRFAAGREKAWANPDLLKSAEDRGKQAEAAGYDRWYGWIWDRWGWPERGEVP